MLQVETYKDIEARYIYIYMYMYVYIYLSYDNVLTYLYAFVGTSCRLLWSQLQIGNMDLSASYF